MLKVQEIRELIKLIDQSAIDEFTYESNGTKVKMKKASAASNVSNAPAATGYRKEKAEPMIETVIERKPDNEPAEQAEEKVTTEIIEENQNITYDHEIVSPMVGTFYAAPSPESDPYVQVGSKVEKDTVVCIVEAMKLFNEIEAEVSGEIVEILVENGQLVEYGQPLFRVKTK